MKILSIRFQNLNSLDGEWQIDFNHPAYQVNNIFAITGPTGSGKTTLLDAICLALYGRTPRLKTISKSGNEILTRQTGFCFSEITFETLKGCYRCHWSQHRARKNPLGDLQQPRHEIVDNSNDKVLENKIKNVARVVEDVTGMTFDQFTRSILLAQGDFAAFLLAKSDTRAPILEQITGTEIYGQISQKVHERTTQEEKNYKTVATEIENSSILTQEEEKNLQQLAADKLSLSKLLQQQVEKTKNSLVWLDSISALEQNISDSEKKHDSIIKLLQKEEPSRLILTRAKTALKLQPQFLVITSLRQQQKQELKTLETKEQEKHASQKIIEALLFKTKETEEALKATETAVLEEKIAANTVRAMDIKLNDIRVHLDELNKKAQEYREQHKEQRKAITSIADDINDKHIHLKQSNKHLQTYAVDENLLENLTLFKEKFNQFDSLTKRNCSLNLNLEKNVVQSKELKKHVLLLSERHVLSQETQKSTIHSLKKITDNIDKLISQYPKLRKSIEEIGETTHLLEKLHILLCNRQELQKEIEKCYIDKKELHISFEKDQKEKLFHTEKLISQERVLRKQEEIVLLATRIRSYEEERTHLEPGNPCPLCGAKEHPFSDENPIMGDDGARKTLETERKRFNEQQKRLNSLQTNITLKLSQKNDIANMIIKLEQQLEKSQESISNICESLKLNQSLINSDLVFEELNTKRLMLETLKKTAEEKDNFESARTKIRGKADKDTESLIASERLLRQAMFKLENQDDMITELGRQNQEHQKKLNVLTAELTSAVTPYGFNSVNQENYQDIMEQLSEKQKNWKEHQRNVQKLSEEIKMSEAELSKIKVLQDKFDQDFTSNAQDIQQKSLELAKLSEKRHTIYDDKDPDTEEKRLQRNHSDTAVLLKKRERKYSDSKNVLAVITEQLRALKESTGLREEQLKTEEGLFGNLLKENNFTGENELKKFQLSDEEILKIQTRLDNLAEQEKRATTLLAEKKKQLLIEKEKNLTFQDQETLVKELEVRNQKNSEVLQEIGKIQGKLQENASLLAKQKEKRKILARYKKELLRWQKLDSLIGSANGNKFRNFAQGITFEIMVQHANKNLQKMSDRYILVRDTTHPLELNVIDNYRAGVMRTTKNLSGGESFLVSLALALGLSNMASKNVRVDSLFLDEGFGTLDEETLETALQTLAGLQQEGKIIGIISHIPLLKERLETQIQVIPDLGGHSRITGPGVISLQ